MSYFINFPQIYYKLDKKQAPKLAIDILRRVAFRNKLVNESQLFFDYDLKDSDTLESIAERLYDNANYHWIIMLYNNIFNQWTDFLINDTNLREYITNKYGSGNEDKTHHYELENGNWTSGAVYLEDSNGNMLQDSNGDDILKDKLIFGIGQPLPISNRDYEIDYNEKNRRKIKLIDPKYIGQIVVEFNKKIGV